MLFFDLTCDAGWLWLWLVGSYLCLCCPPPPSLLPTSTPLHLSSIGPIYSLHGIYVSDCHAKQ